MGFKLAGVHHAAADREDIETVLRDSIAAMDEGLVIVEEDLLSMVSEERLRQIEEKWGGILLALPSPGKPGTEAADIFGRLVRRAIGYHMRVEL